MIRIEMIRIEMRQRNDTARIACYAGCCTTVLLSYFALRRDSSAMRRNVQQAESRKSSLKCDTAFWNHPYTSW